MGLMLPGQLACKEEQGQKQGPSTNDDRRSKAHTATATRGDWQKEPDCVDTHGKLAAAVEANCLIKLAR